MALHFPILVNDNEIGYVVITRRDNLRDDRPNEYDVEIDFNGERFVSRVSHWYDDGALVLIRRALATIIDTHHTALLSPHVRAKRRGLYTSES